MMPLISDMDDEPKFQNWSEIRRDNEFDSSGEESKSTSGILLVPKKQKLVSRFASHENSKGLDTDRSHHKGKNVPENGRKIRLGKVRKPHIQRRRNEKLVNNAMGRHSDEELNRKKNNTTAYDPSALDDVKIFMVSLLEDLKNTRENLFRWMREELQELVVDDPASRSDSRNGRYGRENVQVQQKNDFKEIVQVQYNHTFADNVQWQHQKDLKSGMRDRSSNDGSLDRSIDRNEAAGYHDHFQALEDKVDYDQNTGSMASRADEKGETILVSSVLQHFPSGQLNSSSELVEDRVHEGQAIGLLSPTKKAKEESLALTANLNSSLNTSNQVASSMYLTLPTVLTQPFAQNYWLQTSSCNYAHPRTEMNGRDAYPENALVMVDSSAYGESFSDMPQEERPNSTSASKSIGTGFQVDQGVDGGFSIPSLRNVPKENPSVLGLTMNRGAIRFSGGSYALSEQYVANNFHKHSNYC